MYTILHFLQRQFVVSIIHRMIDERYAVAGRVASLWSKTRPQDGVVESVQIRRNRVKAFVVKSHLEIGYQFERVT